MLVIFTLNCIDKLIDLEKICMTSLVKRLLLFLFFIFFSFIFRNNFCNWYYLCCSKRFFFNRCRIILEEIRFTHFLTTYVCVYVIDRCVCMCVFTSIHREGFICLDQLDWQGKDQRCFVEDISVLCQFPSSLL